MLITVKSRIFFSGRGPTGMARFMALLCSLALVFTGVGAAGAAMPPSLKTVPVPEPVNLGLFLKSGPPFNPQGFPTPTADARAAVIALGKAFFWDAQLGSDGQACASCHFQSGADVRARNQINPNLNGGDSTFQVKGPNQTVVAADFPFFQVTLPDFPPTFAGVGNPVVRNFNDVMSSMGVFFTPFLNVSPGARFQRLPGPEVGKPTLDPVFHVGGSNSRRVEPRNTPTAVNAVFNFSNFWDGRARNLFNGVSPFGELDPDAKIFVNGPTGLTREVIRIPDSSLASQAVGPPGSPFEMSFAGRSFPEIGQKMLSPFLQPLKGQHVAPDDSVFGPPDANFPNAQNIVNATGIGLVQRIGHDQTYVALIKRAFQDQYWNHTVRNIFLPISNGTKTGQFTQMEANFALFWGLAVQMYEATLVSDDSKYDQVQEGRATFTPAEADGANFFFSGSGNCSVCHFGSEFTGHSVANIRQGIPANPPFFLPSNAIVVDGPNVKDNFIYNIAVRPTTDDIIRGGTAPSGLPLSFTLLSFQKATGTLDPRVAPYVPDLPAGAPSTFSVNGAAKVPGLRNVELTGPYMHNGSMSTLRQVVEFYARGGNFASVNPGDVDNDLKNSIGNLQNNPTGQNNLVAFLLTLTDNRVKIQSAPFDHPQLLLPSGDGTKALNGVITETKISFNATGRNGDPAHPLQPFLGLNPTQP